MYFLACSPIKRKQFHTLLENRKLLLKKHTNWKTTIQPNLNFFELLGYFTTGLRQRGRSIKMVNLYVWNIIASPTNSKIRSSSDSFCAKECVVANDVDIVVSELSYSWKNTWCDFSWIPSIFALVDDIFVFGNIDLDLTPVDEMSQRSTTTAPQRRRLGELKATRFRHWQRWIEDGG